MLVPAGSPALDASRIEVIAPNLKRRLSGVTSTIIQLVPVQARTYRIAVLGPGLPADLPRLRAGQLPALLRRPAGRPFRIWHARRNVEMAAGLLLKRLFRAPLRLVFTSAAQRRHKPFTKWLIRRMDAVIATGARSGSFLDVPHKVVMHGVDTARFRRAETVEDTAEGAGFPGRRLVGCFGRVRYQKGTDLFVAAMLHLLPRFPDWSAVITGRVTGENAEFAAGLQHRVRAAGLEKRVLFLGEVPDVAVWYRRLDLFVAPSRNEGFGLTPLEAMASGAAVVASDAGAYAEMVEEGVTGSVVPAGNGAALTAAIRRYMEDPALAEAHGANGLRSVMKRFPLEKEADGIAQVYEALWARG